jgi:hypothetical protein
MGGGSGTLLGTAPLLILLLICRNRTPFQNFEAAVRGWYFCEFADKANHGQGAIHTVVQLSH